MDQAQLDRIEAKLDQILADHETVKEIVRAAQTNPMLRSMLPGMPKF